MTTEGDLTEAAFVERYAQTPVAAGPDGSTLQTALALEEAFCPADKTKRTDPNDRLAYLAKIIGEDSLDPEHRYLLRDTES